MKILQGYSEAVRKAIGQQLALVQWGSEPADWKPMSSIGPGVREIRIHLKGEYRVIYVVIRGPAVVVLHIFRKKSRRTPQAAIATARSRLKDL